MSVIKVVYTHSKGLRQIEGNESGFSIEGGINIDHSITSIIDVSSNYTILKESTVLVDASSSDITITIPDASSNQGRKLSIKKIDSSANSVIISPASGNIDGQSTATIETQWTTLTFQAHEGNWYII